jgi:hypothetical protein
MNMQKHILEALREQFYRWEALLATMSETQIADPLLPSDWSTKDVIVHLWAWQQRSNARIDAAVFNREPEFPRWMIGQDPNAKDVDQTNAWIYDTYREKPWSDVYKNWREGFLRLLGSSEGVSEMDFLDGEKYTWLEGYPLAIVYLATYEHHQEHYDKLIAWLDEHG